MTIITEIDLKFKSGNDVPVADVRLTREEWDELKAHIIKFEEFACITVPAIIGIKNDQQHAQT